MRKPQESCELRALRPSVCVAKAFLSAGSMRFPRPSESLDAQRDAVCLAGASLGPAATFGGELRRARVCCTASSNAAAASNSSRRRCVRSSFVDHVAVELIGFVENRVPASEAELRALGFYRRG